MPPQLKGSCEEKNYSVAAAIIENYSVDAAIIKNYSVAADDADAHADDDANANDDAPTNAPLLLS